MSGTDNAAIRRISALLDENSFVEIGGSVTARSTDYNVDAKKEASDGVVTGYGTIGGDLVYVYSQDPAVLGGTIGEMHGKKILKIYELAEKMGAPVIGLLDSAGIRLEESMDALMALGSIYNIKSSLSGVIPQITGVFGKCGGGLSFIPAISDFVFMDSDKGELFVNSPDTIKDSNIDKFDNTKASYQAEMGNVEFAGSESEMLSSIRALVSILPKNFEDEGFASACNDDLNRSCAGIDAYTEDTLGIISSIADNNEVIEVAGSYGKAVINAFIQLNGSTVGVVACRKAYTEDGELKSEFNGQLTAKSVRKAAKFVGFCDAFNIPVLTIAEACGFFGMPCTEDILPKAAARLLYAYSNATVPKVTLNIGNSYGSAAVLMGSKAIGADIVYGWNNANIGAMDPKNAAKILSAAGGNAAEIEKKYCELQTSVASAASRGYIDTIIAPEDSRKYIIGAFEMLYSKRESVFDKKHGTV